MRSARAWLVASTKAGRRETGFWVFLASNILWVLWGVHDSAYALIALQVVLAAMNVRGVRKNERALNAHAWVALGGHIVNDSAGPVVAFTPLVSPAGKCQTAGHQPSR